MTNIYQASVDCIFVQIVAQFVDLDRIADQILAVHGGWED